MTSNVTTISQLGMMVGTVERLEFSLVSLQDMVIFVSEHTHFEHSKHAVVITSRSKVLQFLTDNSRNQGLKSQN